MRSTSAGRERSIKTMKRTASSEFLIDSHRWLARVRGRGQTQLEQVAP